MRTRIGAMLEGVMGGMARKASRNSLGTYIINAPHEYGQPLSADNGFNGITPRRMREIVMKTPTAGAALSAILDFTIDTEFGVRNVDPSKEADPMQVALVRQLMRDPNDNQTWRRFRRSYARDLETFGFAGIEIEPTTSAIPKLNVLDNEKLRVDFDEHGKILGFNMTNAAGVPMTTADGQHAWKPDEVIWSVLDEQSNTLYGTSRIATLYACGVLESLILSYIGGKFTDSNVPYGVLNLGDISDDELKKAVEYWNEQAENRAQHRIIMTGSRGKFDFVQFGDSLKDLDCSAILSVIRRMIMGVLGVTLNELGESDDVNKSNGYNLSFTFKKRALEPLLLEMCETLTKFLLHRYLGFTDLEFYFNEIDSRDELLAAQIDELNAKNGFVSINEVRNRQGKVSVEGGDEPNVFTGSAYIPVSMVNEFARIQYQLLVSEWQTMQFAMKVQAAQLVMSAQQPQGGEGGASTPPALQNPISPPLIRPPAFPEKMTTPGGTGSSTPKNKLPDVKLPKNAGNKQTNSQRARGPVQIARNTLGVRKEDNAA